MRLKLKKKKTAKTDDDAPEQVTYDDLMKAVKDIGEKLDGIMGSKKSDDEDKEESEDEEEKEEPKKKADDEDMEESEDDDSSTGSRLDKLEAAVAKILESLGNEGAQDEDEEESEDSDESEKDMSGDEDMEESEDESCDDEEGEEGEESQKKAKSGDAARFEILTPGKKFSGEKARLNCLKAFSKTEDGKEVLAKLGMKKPVIDAKSNIDMIFMAASALMKSKRGVGLKGTKDADIKPVKFTDKDVGNTASEPMTAEQVNEINAKHFGVAK